MKISDFKISTKLIVGFAIPLSMFVVVAMVSLSITDKMKQSNKMVDHTHVVIGQANSILGSAVDMETGMRGFLLAGDDAFLDPYTNGSLQFTSMVSELKNTVSDNPAQVELLTEIQSNILAWQTEVVEPVIKLRRKIGHAETMDDMAELVGEARGKVFFDKFRDQIGVFIERERVLMDQRQELANGILASKDASQFDQLTKAVESVEHTHTVIEVATEILASAVDMETGVRGYLLAGKDEFLDPYNSGKEKFSTLLNGLKETVNDNPAQVTLLDEINITINEWNTVVVEPVIDLRRQIGDAATMNDMAELVGEARGKVYFDKFRGQIATFIGREQGLMDERKASAESTTIAAKRLIKSTTGIALFIAGVVVFMLVRSIVGPINQLVARFKDIAQGEGDLTIRVDDSRRDEIGQLGKWFNAFVTKIHDVIAEVADATSDVAAASIEIAASSEQMASGTKEQSVQISQISSAIEEMSASIVEVARQSADATNSANESEQLASEGGIVVNDTIADMKSINDTVSSSAISVQELGKRSEQIGEVIAVIDDIADQTNLLALNAAIEAARAGDAGRGFAVVADEVRKLADRTTEATEVITASIKAIQSETSLAVEKMDTGAEQVLSGAEKAGQAGNSLKMVVSSSQDVSAMIQSIAAATEQQSTTSEEVSRNIENIAEVTMQTSEGTLQSAAAATQLSQQAEVLQELVGQFKTSKS